MEGLAERTELSRANKIKHGFTQINTDFVLVWAKGNFVAFSTLLGTAGETQKEVCSRRTANTYPVAELREECRAGV